MSEVDLSVEGKRVALLGFGQENRAMLPYLLARGAKITVLDRQTELGQSLPEGVGARLGDEYLSDLNQFELIFRSPGIPYYWPELQAARDGGAILTSQTAYFMSQAKASIIGVTGTKGKGTTASLIAAMLEVGVKRGEIVGQVYLAGNIGQPPIEFLERLTEKDWVVLELSSYQLQDLDQSPDIAVVLNITVDHLDYHRDEAEYIAAKKSIVRYQDPADALVVALDSVTSLRFAEETPAKTYFFSRLRSVDQGAYVDREAMTSVLKLRLPGREEETICQTDEVKLVGDYNLENLAAAAVAAALAGASVASIREVATTFAGLPHRLQFVARRGGVDYYDDSKATTPDATAAAVASFERPIVLIAGGSSKGADFSQLGEAMASVNLKAVVSLGQEGPAIVAAARQAGAEFIDLNGGQSMIEAVSVASSAAEPGDVVLLSPAAASFDLFANAEDRGNQFQAAVNDLPDEN